ncbi:MAG: type II secretion system F family protein [Chloroflexi bacterium]|nr:type II secretion system F family protein [Chloroflexota bacterium]
MPTIVLIIGGVVVLLLLGAGLFITLTQERSLVEERLDKYLEEQPLEFGSSEDEGGKEEGSFLTNMLNRRLEGTSFADRVKESLARADIKMKPGEYFAAMLLASIGTGIVGFFFGGGFSAGLTAQVFMLFGLIGGLFIPNIYVKRQQGLRLKRFGDQLPDMLNLMVNGLRAGFSTMQAIEAVSKEMPEPINIEFRRVYQEMQLGIPMEVSLDNLLRRIPSEDLDLVVTAINVQREVGGNLSEILETITHTIRERIRIKGEIKTLTAQVVYSGRFLSLLPLIISGILWVLNRNYMMQFFLEPKACGISILACGAIMIMIGYFVMQKIADIEV